MSNADRLFWWCDRSRREQSPVYFNGLCRGEPVKLIATIGSVELDKDGIVTVVYSVDESNETPL